MADTAKKKNGPPEFLHVARPRDQAIQFATKSVIVKVGTPITTFHVDEKLISDASPFFAAALKKEWREGQTRVVNLPEEEPESFNVYLNWLYSRQVFLDKGEGESRKHEHGTTAIINAYALGDCLMDIHFKDAVCDAFAHDLCSKESDKYWVTHERDRGVLYEKTTPGCQLRRLLVYRMSQLYNSKLLHENDTKDFLLDLAKLKLDESSDGKLSIDKVAEAVARCDFHEHEAGIENCYRTKYANMSRHIMASD